MNPDELVTLQLAYGRAIYEAERWRTTADALHKRIGEAAATVAAETISSPIEHDSPLVPSSYGVRTRVARKLGVSVSLVARVAKGTATSGRISDAIKEELLSINNHRPEPLIVHMRRVMNWDDKQLCKRVAERLGVKANSVRKVFWGQKTSKHISEALDEAKRECGE